MAEVFIYRESEEATGAIDFLNVRENESWGALSLEGDSELTDVVASQAESTESDGFYQFDSSSETAEKLVLDDVDHLWVSYAGLRSILEYHPGGAQGALEGVAAGLAPNGEPPRTPNSFDASRWTVVVAKPDALEQDLEEELEFRLKTVGLNILTSTDHQKLAVPDVEQIWTPPHKYAVPQEPGEWWHATIRYMQRGDVQAYLLEGDEATTLAKAVKASLRNDYGVDPHVADDRPIDRRVESLVHCSDRTEELVRNATLFWNASQIREFVTMSRQ